MSNPLKKAIEARRVAVGAQLRFGSPAIAELFSRAGFDWIVIDGEHAPQTPPGIQSQLQAAEAGGTTAIVRLPKNDPDLIRLYLDMGADGILAPFVNTAEEAALGARACRYPPTGTRGFGPSRAAHYGLDRHYFQQANDRVFYLPIIESAEAVDNIDAILAVDGVDSFILGTADLSISLGLPLQYEHPTVQGAIRRVSQAAARAGKPAGIGVYGDVFDVGSFERQVEAGFKLLLIGGDEWMLSACCQRVVGSVAALRR